MRHDPGCFRALAVAYWRSLLRLLVVSTLVTGAYGGWLFWSGLPAGIEGGVRAGGAETLSREKLKEVIDAFKQRELKYEELGKKPRAVADPVE